MDKKAIREALIKLENISINEAEMKYDEFLSGNLIDRGEIVDNDDQSHHRQSIDVSDELEHLAHVHIDHLKAIKELSFEPTEKIQPGAIVSVNGRCMIIGIAKSPFKIGDRSFIGISTEAPIYKCLIGKTSGEYFEFNNKRFRIEAVN